MEILLSRLQGQEIDTGIVEMAEAYSRTHGTSLAEGRRAVSELMVEVVRNQRDTPRSKPENVGPSLEAADDADYSGNGPELTRGVPPETREKTIPSKTKEQDRAPEKRRKDDQYLVMNSHEALAHLRRLAGVSEMDARRFLSEGDEDVPAPKVRARTPRGATYDSRDLEDWVKTWAAQKRRPKPNPDAPLQAAEIGSVAAGRMLFGDRDQHRRCRQAGNSHFLASDFFRS